MLVQIKPPRTCHTTVVGAESAKWTCLNPVYRMCIVVGSGVFGMQHLSQQGVTGQVTQQVALVQVLLHLQADAAHLRQPEKKLAEFI